MPAQRQADAVERCVVERILAGNSPDAVCAEKLFRHGVRIYAVEASSNDSTIAALHG